MSISFKCTEPAKTTVPFDFKELLAQKAHLAGCTDSEYLRDLICMDLHGKTFGELVAEHRRSVIGRQAHELVQLRACN
jgi:hypothetical protein